MVRVASEKLSERKRLLVLLVALLVAVLVIIVPSRAEAAPGFEYSLSVNAAALNDAELAKALDMAKAAGVNTVSGGAVWWYLNQGQPPRSYNWSSLDRLISAAEQRGMKVNLQLSGTPDWVHPNLSGSVPNFMDRIWYPPRGATELGHWGNFVYDVTSRYGGRVNQYEMWNEPNIVEFWKPSPNPGEYAVLLKTSYDSTKRGYPQANVVFAGLSRNDVGYLNAYYQAAKSTYPDAAQNRYFFDILGVHPYSAERSPDRVTPTAIMKGPYGEIDKNFMGITKMKSTMDQQGDTGKNIWLGEFGYSTTNTWMKAVSDDRRALYLKRAYALVRNLPYVTGMKWYSYHPGSANSSVWTIVDANFNPSLTYRALKQTTGAEAVSAAVSLSAPQGGISGVYNLNPVLTNLNSADVTRWEVYADGQLAGTYSQAPFGWDTRGVTNGGHQLMVAAYSRDGSVWPSNIVPVNVDNGTATITVGSLGTDKASYSTGEKVKLTATLSANHAVTVDQITGAARLKGTYENHDFYPVSSYTIGTSPQTFTTTKVFNKPGTYVYWMAYLQGGKWYSLGPAREFTVVDPASALATQVNVSANPAVINIGGATALSGKLTQNGVALSGKRVILEQRPVGATGFYLVPGQPAGGLITGSDGGFYLPGVKPYKNTDYRARFVGDTATNLASSTSPVIRVGVKALVYTNLSTTYLKPGGGVTISGPVYPAHDGWVRMAIWRNGTMVALRSLPLSSSRYSYTYYPPGVGSYAVSISFPGDADHLSAAGATRTFKVAW